MKTKKRSPLAAIVLAVIIGLLVIALLDGVVRPTQVVVARVPIAPGTLLTKDLIELRTIPAGAKPVDALTKIEDGTGKMVAVGRASGDLIVQSVLGEVAGVAAGGASGRAYCHGDPRRSGERCRGALASGADGHADWDDLARFD
jgi:hypothetical protein